mgnify:FL=1
MTTRELGVLVLAGGPDSERRVSLAGADAVGRALEAGGRSRVTVHELPESPAPRGPADLPIEGADVVFPLLHGPWGEGGPLQRILEDADVPFVGSGMRAARDAMDKIHAKSIASVVGAPVLPHAIVNPLEADPPVPPVELPLVLKPVFEGSTLGMEICRTAEELAAAVGRARAAGRPVMAEPFTPGRELTVGLVAPADPRADPDTTLVPLPIVEIAPAGGFYDYAAKYDRDDTRYTVDPDLPHGLGDRLTRWTLDLAAALNIRHLARADFILTRSGDAVFLEINTMPGFTGHSLVPMAARHAGVELPELCARLIDAALVDHENLSPHLGEPSRYPIGPDRAG